MAARGTVNSRPHVKAEMTDQAEPEIAWPPQNDFTEGQQAKVKIMRDNGIVNPVWTMQVCLLADVPLFMECAYLEHESFKGRNIWHNDHTWMRGVDLRTIDAEQVTEHDYQIYKLYREKVGYQGVGPNALTSLGFQNRGDWFGGCWHPRSNMMGACDWFREQLDAGQTMDEIAHKYNPGSTTYVQTNRNLRQKWKGLLSAD